jgi:thiaminase
MNLPTANQIKRARKLVQELEKEIHPFVKKVGNGPFASSISQGTFPIEGIRFYVEQTYHLVMNDMGNLSIYVSKARREEEIDYFLFMTIAEKLMLDSLYLLIDAVGINRSELARSSPVASIAYRTNYFSKLAITGLPGEIALAILLNFPVWAVGARRVSEGLKRHYGLGKPVKETGLLDTDVLDRFSRATKGSKERALRVIAADITDEDSVRSMRMIGRLAVEYEAMVWENYHAEGMLAAKRAGTMA